MGTSVAQIDATYGHLVPDSEHYLRALLDAFDEAAMARAARVPASALLIRFIERAILALVSHRSIYIPILLLSVFLGPTACGNPTVERNTAKAAEEGVPFVKNLADEWLHTQKPTLPKPKPPPPLTDDAERLLNEVKEAIPDVACGASTYIVDYYNSHGGQMPTGEAWFQFWFDYALDQIGPFGAIVAAGLQEQMATDLANKVSATETPQDAQQLCSLAQQL